MFKLLAILAFLGAVSAQNQREFDSIVESLFGPGLSISGTGQNASGTSQNTGGTGQNVSGTSQNTGGIGQDKSGTDQKTSGTGQNTGINGLLSSTVIPPSTTKVSDITNITSCVAANDEVGECVRYYLCAEDLGRVTFDYGLIDIHVPVDEPCPSYLDVCCRAANKTAVINPVTTPVPKITDGPAQNNVGPTRIINGPGQNTSGIVGNVSPSSTISPPNAFAPDKNRTVQDAIDSLFRPISTTSGGTGASGATQNKDGPVQNAGGADQNTGVRNNTPCVAATGEVGECVRYYLCAVDLARETSDYGLIDIHVPVDDMCPYLDVCCRIDNKTTLNPDSTPGPKREGCGYRNPLGVGTRSPGLPSDVANFGEFPWVVAILKTELNATESEGKTAVFVGGGSLIHPSVVLTAAHNVAAARGLRVRAGDWDSRSTLEAYPHQERDVASVEIHNDYNKGNLFYDVAVLFLSAPMDPAPNVGVACLPPPRQKVKGGTKCLTSGWGKDNFGKEGTKPPLPNKMEVSVVDRQPCLESLRKTRLGGRFELHSSFMCAGAAPGQDTCRRDGGSPLVCPIEFEPERYMQSGIVAWGIGCGEDGTPGVYVDVSNLRAWIDDKVKGKGYTIDGYSYTV